MMAIKTIETLELRYPIMQFCNDFCYRPLAFSPSRAWVITAYSENAFG